MPTVSTTRTWVARDALVILSQASSISLAANTISGAFSAGTRFETVAKNVAITPPDSAWEQQSFLGEDSNGFQNQILDEKPVGLATFTGTLVLGEDETIENFMVSGSSAISGTHTRYQIGKNNDNEIAVAVIIRDKEIPNNEAAFAFDNAKVTKYGDVRISGPDSHWEQDITIICLPKDFYWEFKD